MRVGSNAPGGFGKKNLIPSQQKPEHGGSIKAAGCEREGVVRPMAGCLQPIEVREDGGIKDDGPAIALRSARVARAREGTYVRVTTAPFHGSVPTGDVRLVDVYVDGQALAGRYVICAGHLEDGVAELWLLPGDD